MRRRRLFWLTLAFLLVLLGGTLLLFSRTGLVTALVREQLATVLKVPFQVGTTQLDLLDGTLEVHDLTVLRTVGDKADQLKLGSVQVLFSRSLLSLGALRRIVVRDLDLDLDLSPGRELRLDELIKLPATSGSSKPIDLPRIEVHNVTARVVPPDPQLPVLEARIPSLTVAPLAHDPRSAVVSGDLEVPLLGTLHLQGRACSEPASVILNLTTQPFGLRPDEVQQGKLVAGLLTQHQVDARAAASVWFRWPHPAQGSATPPAVPVDVLADLRIDSLSFVPPYFHYPFHGLAGNVQFTLEGGGRLHCNLRNEGEREQARVEGTFALGPTHPIVDLDIEGHRFDITPALYQALDREELDDAVLVWDAFAPRGGEMDMRLQLNTTRERKKAQVALDLTLRGTSVSFLGFPEDDGSRPAFPVRVTNCSGRVSLRPRHLVIHEAVADRGQGQIRAFGEIRGLGDRTNQVLDLAIAATRIKIEPELRDAMARVLEGGDRLYDDFTPQGEVDALCRLYKPAGVTQLLPTLSIHPLGATARYRDFPHQVEDVRGTIEVTREAVCFDLTGAGGGAKVAALGRFLRIGRDRSPVPMEMRFRGDGVPLSSELRNALRTVDPSLATIWDDLGPQGRGSFDFVAWKRAYDGPLSFDLRTDLLDCTAKYVEFPVATRQLAGPFLVTGREGQITVGLQEVRGEASGGAVWLSGQFRREPGADFRVDLVTHSRGTELSDELAEVLDQKGLFRRSLWTTFRPRGQVDAIHRITREPGQGTQHSALRVLLRGITIGPDWLPADATNLVGELELRDGRILTRNLAGNLGAEDTLVRCEHGELTLGDAGIEVDSRFTIDNFRLDEKASRLFRGEVRAAYEARHIRGRLDARDLVVKVHVPRDGPPVTDLNGRFTLRSGQADLGVSVRNMAGKLRIDSCQLREDGAELAGRTEGLSCNIAGQGFTDVQTGFAATQRSLLLSDLTARLHGGTVRTLGTKGAPPTALEYTFPPGNDLRLRLLLQDVQLSDFLAAADNPTAARDYRGLLDANLQLDVPHAELHRLRGRGTLAVRNGHLGTVPIFRSIYSLIRAEKRPTFQDCSGEFEIGEDGVHIPRFSLASPLLRVDGEGRMGFDLWLDLDIAFPNLFPEAHNLFIIPLVYRWVADQLVRFRLWGYLRHLRTAPYFVLTESAPTQDPPGPILPDRQRRN